MEAVCSTETFVFTYNERFEAFTATESNEVFSEKWEWCCNPTPRRLSMAPSSGLMCYTLHLVHTAIQPRRLISPSSRPWEPQNPTSYLLFVLCVRFIAVSIIRHADSSPAAWLHTVRGPQKPVLNFPWHNLTSLMEWGIIIPALQQQESKCFSCDMTCV
jgi:hypothetical protein